MRHLSAYVVFFLTFAIAASSADAAQRRSEKSAPPPPPVQFRVDVATKPMALVRIVNSIPTRTVVGQFDYGMLCLGPRVDIYVENAFEGASTRDYSSAFASEATKAGYRVPGGQNSLFEAQDTTQAELHVGAVILTLNESGCAAVGDANMKATITVEWQVFDPLNKKIVFRATNEGSAKVSVDRNQRIFGYQAARAAFADAAKNILADPNLVEAVKDPRGGPAASASNGALFPEATETPAAASASTAAKQIPRLPLHTKPFREHVDDLRRQVVTVRTPSSTGSAFYISSDLLLTNEHVINGFKRVTIRFLDKREIEATVIALDARRDVALLKVDNTGMPGLAIRTDKPDLTSSVFVIGSPLREEFEGSITSGIVSAFRDHEYGPMIQSDVGVTHGNSGGPMFDDKGNVIGITDLGIPGQNGRPTAVNLFIPIGDALEKLGVHFVDNVASDAKAAHP
jgi:serine protease Do